MAKKLCCTVCGKTLVEGSADKLGDFTSLGRCVECMPQAQGRQKLRRGFDFSGVEGASSGAVKQSGLRGLVDAQRMAVAGHRLGTNIDGGYN